MAMVVPLPDSYELSVASAQVRLPLARPIVIDTGGRRGVLTSPTQPPPSGIKCGPDWLRATGYLAATDYDSEAVDLRRCASATPPVPWSA